MKIQITIQARLSSTRLPEKIFKPIGEDPLIVHILKRIYSISLPEFSIKIITPENELVSIKNRLEPFLPIEIKNQRYEPEFFGGATEDVLGRFIESAHNLSEDDYVVRLTADNPFPAFDILEQSLKKIIENREGALYDYSYPSGLPLGMGFEIIRVSALRALGRESLEDYHREHVTIRFREIPNQYKIFIFPELKEKLNDKIRMTIDESADLEMAIKIWAYFSKMDRPLFSTNKIHELYQKNADFFSLNRNVKQKKPVKDE